MGFRSLLWTFSTIANSKAFISSASITTAGISFNPAFCDASHLLSPAIISYLPTNSFDFLTIIGWTTPLSLIELLNSSRPSLLNIFLG